MSSYEQELRFVEFQSNPERFAETIGVTPPAFADEHALTQLKYLAHYLADPVLDCKAVLVEEQYIDRDHMEDHSVFYSRNLYRYPNCCRRAHFFNAPVKHVRSSIDRIRQTGLEEGSEALLKASIEFSEAHYLGFCVLKPLGGSPVGRTVLKSFPRKKAGEPDYTRIFECLRDYHVHVAGMRLTVRGLPFQEQDKAVAACATTALWTALHAARAFEEIAPFTPAQITLLASRGSLVFGRAMPSQGLSVDQMCQAVQSVGISPVLQRASDFATARSLLHAALLSGVAPVLVVTDGVIWHAITASGMSIRRRPLEVAAGVAEAASRLEKIYVHDDRKGPYLRAEIQRVGLDEARQVFGDEIDLDQWSLCLSVPADTGITNMRPDRWLLYQVLFPMHAKVRITFEELRQIALNHVAAEVKAYRSTFDDAKGADEQADVLMEIESFIRRSYVYQEQLLTRSAVRTDSRVVAEVIEEVSLPRYVAVIRFSADGCDPMDLLIDTTSTDRNIHAVALLVHQTERPRTQGLAEHLAGQFRCRLVAVTD